VNTLLKLPVLEAHCQHTPAQAAPRSPRTETEAGTANFHLAFERDSYCSLSVGTQSPLLTAGFRLLCSSRVLQGKHLGHLLGATWFLFSYLQKFPKRICLDAVKDGPFVRSLENIQL